MVEIAICLAIIAFALVAIIGVLPRGLNVQRDNQAETIINQDAQYWTEAIRNGAQGADELLNHVETIRWVNKSDGRNVAVYTNGPSSPTTFGTGREVVGLMLVPETDKEARADVAAISGNVAVSAGTAKDLAFKYRLHVSLADKPGVSSNALDRAQLEGNLVELTLDFRWPLRGTVLGGGRQTYRTIVQGKVFPDSVDNRLSFITR